MSVLLSLFFENRLPEDFVDTFKAWDQLVKKTFLSAIVDSEISSLDDEQYNYLTNVLNLKEGYNKYIRIYFFNIILNKAKIFEDSIKEILIDFLGTIGSTGTLRSLYILFYKRDKDAALATFEKYRNFYHPIAVKYIELAFRALS